MLIPFGFLASAGGAAGSYELIESQILTSTAALVTFASIPQTYKHLQIRVAYRYTAVSFTGNSYLRLNSDTGTNYSYHTILGNGSAVNSTGAGTNIYGDLLYGNGAFAGGDNVFAPAIIDILDYASTAKNTTIRHLGGRAQSSAAQVELGSGAWYNTSAVTSVSLPILSGNSYAIGSRFSLYGIKG